MAIPPLRERQEDIPNLLRTFIHQISQGQHSDIHLDASAIGTLSTHPWPGNIAELRRLAVRLAELAEASITAVDILRVLETMKPRSVERLDEGKWIADALKRNRFRRKETALELGISRKTLYNKIIKYGLN